ncbi:shikimate dehydrogenase [Rothia sp. ZJ1223]|uniref:shikimate dehydrogenase n=1 Tax=Rothia sp. ZJ1223 TaxID=2811098 RepID=UPI0019586619|nr:shikimate dehydrogenase [Rothia sp. ZJ1223]MBM7050492.1 shikimate dehydrogenase [Rothia sp. ZJ1223]
MTIHNCPKAYVLGHPISHSKSPDLHRAAYRVLGEQLEYERQETDAVSLPSVWQQLTGAYDVRGFSVTMPLKSAIIDHLDELTNFARAVGVVNTVFWRDGKAWGHNTDVSGIVNALNYAKALVHRESVPAILGGGGTATAAVAALRFMGTESIDIFVRDETRASAVSEVAQRLGVKTSFNPLESFATAYLRYPTVVSTLPAGAADVFADDIVMPLDDAVLLDVSYHPWPSPIASAFESAGGTAVSGLEMLMYQAVDQVKLFTGHTLNERLPREEDVINAMCRAVGLPQRQLPAVQVYDGSALGQVDA